MKQQSTINTWGVNVISLVNEIEYFLHQLHMKRGKHIHRRTGYSLTHEESQVSCLSDFSHDISYSVFRAELDLDSMKDHRYLFPTKLHAFCLVGVKYRHTNVEDVNKKKLLGVASQPSGVEPNQFHALLDGAFGSTAMVFLYKFQ